MEDRRFNTWTSKMNNKKYHTVGTIPKSNINIVERDEMDQHINT